MAQCNFEKICKCVCVLFSFFHSIPSKRMFVVISFEINIDCKELRYYFYLNGIICWGWTKTSVLIPQDFWTACWSNWKQRILIGTVPTLTCSLCYLSCPTWLGELCGIMMELIKWLMRSLQLKVAVTNEHRGSAFLWGAAHSSPQPKANKKWFHTVHTSALKIKASIWP